MWGKNLQCREFSHCVCNDKLNHNNCHHERHLVWISPAHKMLFLQVVINFKTDDVAPKNSKRPSGDSSNVI